MVKKSLIATIWITIIFATIVLLANYLAALGIGIRPDFYAYPFYKNSVKTEEAQLQKYVAEICTKAHCKFQYSVKVFKWSVLQYDDAFFVRQNKTIFVKQRFIENFNEDEKRFIVGHEIGHHILLTADEIKADYFAAKYTNAKIGAETLKKTLLMDSKNSFDTQTLFYLQKRIEALEK